MVRWERVAVVIGLLALPVPCRAQIVFNEIRVRAYDNSRVDQAVELRNIGTESVAIGEWIVYHVGDYRILPSGLSLAAGGLLVLHFNMVGTNSATDIFLPGEELADQSDLALYARGTTSITSGGFSNPSNIRSFIQWGGVPPGSQQAVAVTAGLWSSNTYITLPAAGHSVELCSGTWTSPSSYTDQASPSLGQANLCTVSVQNVSWSRVKAIFE